MDFKNSKADNISFTYVQEKLSGNLNGKTQKSEELKQEKSFSHDMNIYNDFSNIGVQVPLFHSDLELIESELLVRLSELEKEGMVVLEDRRRQYNKKIEQEYAQI
jgi:hypothetical protein